MLDDKPRTALFFKGAEGDIRYIFVHYNFKELDKFRNVFESAYPEAKIPVSERDNLAKHTIGNKVNEIFSISKRKRILTWAIPFALVVAAILLVYGTLTGPGYPRIHLELLNVLPIWKLISVAGIFILIIAIMCFCILLLILSPISGLLSSRLMITIYEKGILPPEGEATPVIIRWKDILSIDIRRLIPGIVINFYDPSKKRRKIYIQGYIREPDINILLDYTGLSPKSL
jgi:hypothetical protein